MSGIVVCPVCGDSWEVPDEAYPEDGEMLCDICAGELDWEELADLSLVYDDFWEARLNRL